LPNRLTRPSAWIACVISMASMVRDAPVAARTKRCRAGRALLRVAEGQFDLE
jgi:hypothetical protein